MAYRTGLQRSVKVKKYKRGKQGRKKGRFTRKQRVSSHVRQTRYWGSAKGLPLKAVIKYERRPEVNFRGQLNHLPANFRVPILFHGYFGRDPLDAEAKFIQIYDLVPKVIKEGVLRGIKDFEDHILEFIPANTGNLRRAIMRSLSRYKNRFPVTVRWAAPRVKYASIVNTYTPGLIQLQHRAGGQLSGRGEQQYYYKTKMGDPHAVYHFFDVLHDDLRDAIKDGVRAMIIKYDIPRSLFFWMIKETEMKI